MLFHRAISRFVISLNVQTNARWKQAKNGKMKRTRKKNVVSALTYQQHTNPANYRMIKYIRVRLFGARENLVENHSHALQTVWNWTQLGISYHQFSYNVYNFYYYRSTWILSFAGFLCYECECEKNHWEKRKKKRARQSIQRHKRAQERHLKNSVFFRCVCKIKEWNEEWKAMLGCTNSKATEKGDTQSNTW